MDSDDEMVEEAVEGTAFLWGWGRRRGLGTRKEWRAATGAAPGPAAATVPYAGGPLPGSGTGRAATATPPGARTARRGAGRERGSAGPGPPGGYGRSGPPGHRLHPPSELRTCPALWPPPFRGWKGGVRGRTAPRDRQSRRSDPPRPVLATQAPLRLPALSFRSPLRPAVTADAAGSVPRRSARGRTRHVAAATAAAALPKR